MADFKAEVVRLTIEEHPNADALELARVGDYLSVVRKGDFTTGDLAVYIPEQAVLPEWLIADLGLEGRLAGKDKNRVKAVKLRGILSQGLVYGLDGTAPPPEWPDACTWAVTGEHDRMGVGKGDDVTDFLGITKYEPPIPSHMSGQVFNASGYTPKYDVENIKKYPDVFESGEEVIITEKLHGTWACFGYHPDFDHPIVTSKGLSAKGLAFKWVFPENENNLYVRGFQRLSWRDVNQDKLFLTQTGTTVIDRLHRALELSKGTPLYLMGEIYGHGVQDLYYDTNPMSSPKFRLFDVYVGKPGEGEYIGARDLINLVSTTEEIAVDMVPLVYHGPYSRGVVHELTSGKTTLDGDNIREGVVIKPAEERTHDELGRVILKSVSEAYLLRKGGTELN